jgi:hypothetical protein
MCWLVYAVPCCRWGVSFQEGLVGKRCLLSNTALLPCCPAALLPTHPPAIAQELGKAILRRLGAVLKDDCDAHDALRQRRGRGREGGTH